MEKQASTVKYSARFRFRVTKRLNLREPRVVFKVAGRDVTLTGGDPSKLIYENYWLVILAKGFGTQGDAEEFAERLKVATAISSLKFRYGVDVGDNRATTSASTWLKEQFSANSGGVLRDNIHGVDVYADDDNVRFLQINAEATVHADPDPIINGIAAIADTLPSGEIARLDELLLLNAALLNPEPLAKLVLAVSAVEMMAANERWTDGQRQLLARLAEVAASAQELPIDEAAEVADAIRRTFRISVRQGGRRALDRLGVHEFWDEWDKLYGDRSALFHGARRTTNAEHLAIAERALTLCARIVLVGLGEQTPLAAQNLDAYYPIPHSEDRAMLALIRDASGNVTAELRPPSPPGEPR
jgi:hypothetical protein